MREENAINFFRNNINYIKSDIENINKNGTEWDKYAELCQILSNRYLPYAESRDGVLISVSNLKHSNNQSGFDFFAYRKDWNAKNILDKLQLTVEDIEKAWERILWKADNSPISKWNDLIEFINKEKIDVLEDEALLAENFKIMAKIINLFYKDITGKTLYSYHFSPEPEIIHHRKGIKKDEFQYMEFIVNEFGLNPKPKLIFMVEGEGELSAIPDLVKWAHGKSLSSYRIQIEKLSSIGEFNSKQMARFIDHFHDLQTIVYFVLDNEGNPKPAVTMKKLISKESQYMKGKTITKEDFFTVWDKNIEFDNFTDEEIATAMSEFCRKPNFFKAHEVKDSRDSFGTRNLITLEKLFNNKVNNYKLNKVKLLSILFDYLKINPKIKLDNDEKVRPILKIIENVTRYAIRNHQPTRLKTWLETQESDWLRNSYKK